MEEGESSRLSCCGGLCPALGFILLYSFADGLTRSQGKKSEVAMLPPATNYRYFPPWGSAITSSLVKS